MTARLLKNESLIKKLELSLQFKGMEKLKDLSERFQAFLSRTFPGFSDLSLTNIAVLNGLEDKITKRRPLVNFQIVNSSSDQLVGQIDQTSLDMPDTQLAVVLENAKTILSFKQKVLEANLSNYTKFSSVAQDTMQRLSEFNEKSERLFELEKAASIDPRQILPNMFSVVRDFANNLEVLGSSVSFLFYHERYFASSSLSEHEAEQSLVVAAINEAKDGLDGTVRQISEHSTRFSRGAVDPIEKLKAINQLRMACKRLKEEGEDTTENYVFNCVCLLSERLLGKVREAAKIYGTMYQLAETCYTALFVKTEILDEHRRLFSAIRSATEDPNIPSYLEFFLKLNQIKMEVNEEIVFLNKVLDLTLETSENDEDLFYDHYKDAIIENIDQINGLITAFLLVKTHLVWSEDLLKVEQERAGLLKELGLQLENVESSLQRVPPGQKREQLLKMFVFFGECVLKHDELMKKSEQSLVLFDSSKLIFQNILNYRQFLKLSHKKLASSRKEFYTKIDQMSDSVEQVSLQVQRPPPTVATSSPQPQGQSQTNETTSSIDFMKVIPDDAFLLDTTLRLHENTKATMDLNMNPETRMDMAALLLATSSGRDLTWPNIEQVFNLWGKCFASKTMVAEKEEQAFKEVAHKIKRVADNHLETNVSAAQSAKDPRIVGYCQSRQEAETFIKNALEQLVALFTHGNKVDHEAKKVNRELEYTNDSLFEPLNQFTNAVVMLSSLVEQTRSRASSVQRHVFYQNLNALVGPVLNSCVLFTGSADLTSFMAFMANFRSIIDVNSVHVNIFTKLKLALAAPSETTLREVFKQAKLYKTLYHEKLLPALKLIQNGPIPKMFSHYSQSDLQKFKKTIEENTAVMEEIDRYLTIESNVPDDNDSFDFVDQRKRFSRNLADISANSNEDLRKWVNQLINSILLKTT